MSLSEAIEVLTVFARRDAHATETNPPGMSRREAAALKRVLDDARISLEQLSRGVIRREGRRF
jgi:hypothetical protein